MAWVAVDKDGGEYIYENTPHCDDNKYDWDEKAVIEETFSLMEQLNRG